MPANPKLSPKLLEPLPKSKLNPKKQKFWSLLPKFLVRGRKSFTQTRNFFDSTTFLNAV